jgi:hypothetical protein
MPDPNKPAFDPNKPFEAVNTEGKPQFDATKPFDVVDEKKKSGSNGTSNGTKSDSAQKTGSSDIKPIDFTIKSPTDAIVEAQSEVNKKYDAATKAREKQLTSTFHEATKLSEDDDAEITSRLENERTKTGFMNRLKDVGTALGGYINEVAIKPVNTALTMFGKTTQEDIENNKGVIPLLADSNKTSFESEIKEVKIQAKKNREKLTDDEIKSRAEQLFVQKEKYNIYVDKANSYLDNLSQDDKKILELDRYDDIKNLNTASKQKLQIQSALKSSFGDKAAEYNEIKSQVENLHKNNQQVPQDVLERGIALENELKGISIAAEKNYDSLLKDKSDLGTAEQEFDLFKRENRDWANIGKTIEVGFGDLGVGMLDAYMWFGNIVGSATGSNKKEGWQEAMDKATTNNAGLRDTLNKQREKLRKPVESLESAEGFVNYATDLVASQIPILVATSTGTRGLAVIGASSTGQKYAEMNDEVKSGKATYSPMQMAVAPLLSGGAEVISELPTLSILKKGGRVLAAVEHSAPELLERSIRDRAIAWGKDYGLDMGKEMAGEEFTQFTQNFTDKYVLGKNDVGLLDGTGKVFKDTFVLTSMLIATPQIAGAVIRPFQTKTDLGILDENSRKIIEFSHQMETEGLSETEKSVLKKQIDKLTASSSKIIANTIDKMGSMPDELYDEVKSLNEQAGKIKAEAREIDLDSKLKNKKELLASLEEDYKAIHGKRQDIIEGRTSVVDVLPLAEQDKLKRQALEDLVTELNPDGSKDMEITNKQILDRANEIYAESKANEVEGNSSQPTAATQQNSLKPEGNYPQKEDRVIEYTDGAGKPATLNTKDIEFTFDKNKFVFTENGNRIGHIELGPQNKNEVSVKLSGIFNPSLNKKGIGTIMYKEVANYLKDTYNTNLVSDTNRSTDSDALWKKLEREGLATKEGEIYKYNHEGQDTGAASTDGDVRPSDSVVDENGNAQPENNLSEDVSGTNDSEDISGENDAKDKAIKVGNYNYQFVDGNWTAVDKDGNAKPVTKSKATKRNKKGELIANNKENQYVPDKVYEQHAENFDFTQGTTAIQNSNEVTQETFEEDVAKHSSNPAEVAETLAFVQTSDATEGLDYKSKAIAQSLGVKSVDKDSFNRFGDRNNINGSIALQYFAKKGKGQGIDLIAMNAEIEAYGDYNANEPRITPEDVIEFINDNPGGAHSFLNSAKRSKIDALKSAFTQLTGLPASEKYINKAIEQNKEKTFRFYNGEVLYQLTDEELLSLSNELDQISNENGKENNSTTVGPTSADQQNSETSQQQSSSESSLGESSSGEKSVDGTESGNTESGVESISKDSTYDQIGKWLDKASEDLDKFGEENLSMGIPLVAAKAAIAAMKAAHKAGKLAAEIIQAGIDAVKQTEWFQNLTKPEQQNFEDNFESEFLQGISRATSNGQPLLIGDVNDIPVDNERQAENIMNRALSENISEDDAFQEVRDTFESARNELEKSKPKKQYFREQYRKFISRFTDRQYTAKRLLDKSGLANTKNLIINSHGASGKARMLFEEAYDKIYRKLSVADRNTLDEIIQAKRFIAIDENRESRGLDPVTHPNFIDKNKSEKFLSKLEQELGPEKFNDLVARADHYFKTYKTMLKDMLNNGLISQASFDSMNDVDYQPRVFLEFVTNFDGDLETNKRSNNLDSGGLSASQIKEMKEGDANALVLNSEWLLTNSLLSRTRAIAKNNINKRFMTDEYLKAKERFEKLDPKNLTGDDARFYKYFKELSSKVIDNPIVGYNDSGNPKYQLDKTPANFAKMYYYIDGVQHQFFLEKELHESWNDNIDGFLSSNAKEFISYASVAALVKAIATGNNPAFPIVNTPRDFMFTVTFSDQYSNFVPKAILQVGKDVVKAMREIRKDGDVLKLYFDHGGAMDFLSSQGTLKKESALGRAIDKMVSPNARDVSKKIFSAVTLHKISAYSEMMFRLGIFQRSIKNQLADLGLKDVSEVTDKQQLEDIYNSAVANARGILDFNQGGYITKDLESVIPYINVAFQGGRVALNALEKNPVATTSRVLQVATMASAVPIGISLALIGANKDDDDDKSSYDIYLEAMDGISPYQKSKYMNIVTGTKNEDGEYMVLKIAKAQELSPVMSVTDDIYANMIRSMAGREKKTASHILGDAMFTFNSNVMPLDVTSPAGLFTRTPIVKGTLSYVTGFDFFREEPLSSDIGKVPKPVEGINMNSVEDFYKKLGESHGLSPVRSKAFVESLITSPNTNPFVGILYGGADAISSDKNAKAIGKKLLDDIGKSTVKRVVSYSSDFNRKLQTRKELQEKIDKVKIENYKMKAEFNDLAKQFINKEFSKEELKSKLNELEPDDKKRMWNKIKDKMKLKDIDGAILDIKYEQTADVKALMIMHYYGNIYDKSKDSKEIYRQMKKAGGILTPAVKFEYNKLLKELEK